MKGISTGYMDALWSKAVKYVWGACAICGAKTNLESHHIAKRRHGILRHEIDNGICVCVNPKAEGTCHNFVHTKLGERKVAMIIGEEKYDRLCALERKTLKDHLRELGMSKSEFRSAQKNRLKLAMDRAYKEAV